MKGEGGGVGRGSERNGGGGERGGRVGDGVGRLVRGTLTTLSGCIRQSPFCVGYEQMLSAFCASRRCFTVLHCCFFICYHWDCFPGLM